MLQKKKSFILISALLIPLFLGMIFLKMEHKVLRYHHNGHFSHSLVFDTDPDPIAGDSVSSPNEDLLPSQEQQCVAPKIILSLRSLNFVPLRC
jgi:hypothetical protein